ncbi:MAG: hypothetical protein MRY83_16980, partial [Flavobacteriales bacterium]|nr:hypothetical protein [Flavobacteriales bacterium]
MKTRLTLLFLLTLQFVSAQDLVWARHLAGKGVSTPANLTPGKSMGLGIAVDSQENVYVTGYCNDSVDFDPSSGSFFLEGGNNDIFLAKYSKSGGLVWAHVLVSDGWNYSYDVEVDKYDNVFITGFCASTADFDPDTGIALLSGVNGGWFYFIAKYNSDGKYLWANGFSAVNGAQSFDVCLDSNSNVYVTANFYGSIDIDPSSGSYILNGVNNGQSILCAKYDSLGSLIWGFAIDDVGQYGGASSISSDDGDYIYVTGYYGKPIDLDPSSSSFILTPNTTADRFVAKYKKDGTFIWARSFDVNNNGVFTVNRNVRAEADIDKNVVICGVFSGTVDLDPGSGIHQVISPGTHGTFFVKLDSAGNFVWGNAINNGFSMPSDFKIDCNNDIVITGSFTQGDFD